MLRINKLTSVFYASVLLEFRHHIVKVAVDPRGDSRVDPLSGSADYVDNVMTQFMINNRTGALH